MKRKSALLLAFFIFSLSHAFAHALWIETAASGQKGHVQEVKIYFGEYESNAPDSAKTWFSNLKDFSLLLTAPDGTVSVLKTAPGVLHYASSFIPEQDGQYTLSIVHEVKTIYENAKIEYYAFARVTVGTPVKAKTSFPARALLTISPEQALLKAGQWTAVQVNYHKKPFAKQKITVISPAGKAAPETGQDGKFILNAGQKGNYFLEAFAEEPTPGKLDGNAYEKVWHVATYFIAAG
jgi:hypothetical protein